MTLIRWLITLPVIIVTVAFCVANPQNISVIFSPLHAATEMPLYAIGLGALALGFLWGVLLMGLQTLHLRLKTRRQRKQIEKLEKQLAEINKSHTGSNAETVREPAQQHLEKRPGA